MRPSPDGGGNKYIINLRPSPCCAHVERALLSTRLPVGRGQHRRPGVESNYGTNNRRSMRGRLSVAHRYITCIGPLWQGRIGINKVKTVMRRGLSDLSTQLLSLHPPLHRGYWGCAMRAVENKSTKRNWAGTNGDQKPAGISMQYCQGL